MHVHVASADGEAKFWLLVDRREHFLSFRGVPLVQRRLGRGHPHHLYWPDVDVDLTVDSIDKPTLQVGRRQAAGGLP